MPLHNKTVTPSELTMSAACDEPKRVLIFLLGSLGDTIVALPSLHLIARSFPRAERRVLTDQMQNPKATPMAMLLDGTNLVQGYFHFPNTDFGKSRLRRFLELSSTVRRWRPDLLIYLHERQGWRRAFRDKFIFRLLGLKRTVGIPTTRALQAAVFDEDSGNVEHRAKYLARALAPLGDARLTQRESWDLALTADEHRHASQVLKPLCECAGVLAFSIGTKINANDWEDGNWRGLIRELSARMQGWGLVALGAQVEHQRSSDLLGDWHGASLNLCGQLGIRQSAAILQAVRAFIGHDSGPMHLAAAVGTRCVAVFSARNPPGRWFPFGERHAVFYEKTECAGCGLVICEFEKKKCIMAVTVEEVARATLATVGRSQKVAWEVAAPLEN